MKKILLTAFGALSLLYNDTAVAQTFTAADTVYFTTSVGGTYHNDITNISSQAIDIRWSISNTNFPQSWLDNLGICDLTLCRTNNAGTNSLLLGGPYTTTETPYHVGLPGLYDVVLAHGIDTAADGDYFLTVSLKDMTNAGGYNKTATYIFRKFPTSVSKTVKAADEVTLYPNPARNELNVLFNPVAGIKTIAVYNLIGKVVTVYKLTDDASAKLDIGNMPTGIYFIRLINEDGQVVATRKFTHQ